MGVSTAARTRLWRRCTEPFLPVPNPSPTWSEPTSASFIDASLIGSALSSKQATEEQASIPTSHSTVLLSRNSCGSCLVSVDAFFLVEMID